MTPLDSQNRKLFETCNYHDYPKTFKMSSTTMVSGELNMTRQSQPFAEIPYLCCYVLNKGKANP